MSRPRATSAAYAAVLAHPETTLIGLDFDGTLAPIVDDPERAYADPGAIAALARLGPQLGAIVIVTGRPVRTAVRLGGFRGVAGLESLVIVGQYGVERWDAATDAFVVPPEPPAIGQVVSELPAILGSLGLAARVEHKGRAVGVHTRTLADPASAFDELAEPIAALASRHELHVEPGKNVWEIRAPGTHKGAALRGLVAETGARQVIFAGDDLGDLPAFEAVRALRDEGLAGLLLCSASHEEDALAGLADIVVDGPRGIAAWLHQLADDLAAR